MITAAATTGPARGPRPASSTPAIKPYPAFLPRSSEKHGSQIEELLSEKRDSVLGGVKNKVKH